jgi:cation-transporting ATPase E
MSVRTSALQGLSESEANARRARGQGNNIRLETSRSYGDIFRQNVFTFINSVLFGIGIILVVLGLYTDALLSVGIALLNVVVGVIQELRAKHTLDKIALLTRPKANVIRDGQEKTVDPTEIVLGDVLVVRPGDQIVVDGNVVGDGKMDVDESLLTGESDLIPKQAGDEVLSGSFCVTGSACYEAKKVGAESFANKLTATARTYRVVKTPLQNDIDFVIRLLLMFSVQLGILFGLSTIVDNRSLSESARIAAVVTGLIPNGLFFMISIAYAMGAVRMVGQGALIQQANAVESMSNVDTLCLDKTGTLTANRINFHQMVALNGDEDGLKQMLGIYAASTAAGNRTSEAIHEALGGEALHPVEEVPFSSERKWSALAFNDESMRGVYVLGAPEMLQDNLAAGTDRGNELAEWAEQGLRVLLFACQPETTPLFDASGSPQLPNNLTALGIISLTDELRPEAEHTLKGFAEAGIRLKIISGDNPDTVAALAKQAGLSGDFKVISGPELDTLSDYEFSQAAEDNTIFGRITPQQKEKLVDALRANGHYVAMIGDGVNDVLSLKKAQIGVAMQSGSQATRGVADIVLLNDSFAALPPAFQEGQRIINGMQDIMRLFLTRVVYQALIIVGVAIIGLGFPFTPVNTSLLSLFTVGIPTMALAAWSRPGPPARGLIRSVIHFVLPASFMLAMVGLGLYSFYYITVFTGIVGASSINSIKEAAALEAARGIPINQIVADAEAQASSIAQTVLTTLITVGGLLLVIFVEPPTRAWVGGDEYSGDWRPTILAVALILIYGAIMLVPALRTFFELAQLNLKDYAIIGVLLVAWGFALRFIWRARLFDRFLGLNDYLPKSLKQG